MSEFIYEKIKDSDGIDCYIKKGEIVRCKDCKKHHNLKYPDCLWTDDDFFCADGERKDK